MLTSADLIELERCARGLDSDNHHRFLSEALACLRQRRDPIAVYELLAKLQAFARDKEVTALIGVRRWLDAQLVDPAIRSVDDLELRLVWARRIARIAKAQKKEHDSHPATAPAPPSPRSITELRARFPLPPQPPNRPLPPRFSPASATASVVSQTAPLPVELEVLFANHRDAVTLLKQIAKAGAPTQTGASRRPARELSLASSSGPFPVDIHMVSLLITSPTAGLSSYLKELNGPQNGAAFPFRVTQLERQGSRVVAHEILLHSVEDSDSAKPTSR